jgi:NDP-sugar pyrophosphorylase family protein
MVEAHRRSGAQATMALVPNPAPDVYNGVRLDEDDRVTAFVPAGPAAAGSFHFIGIQVVNKSIIAPLADGVPAETVKGIYRERVQTSPGDVRGWRLALPFVDIGTPADYLRTALTFTDGYSGSSIVERGANVDPSAILARTVVWADATIGAAADLDGCIVAGRVTVPAGFRARGAIIQPAETARAGEEDAVRDGLAVFPLQLRT